uniref:Ribonuclease H2 subunit B wHTH domain-containing protein n=1 Tax=Oryza barthii TaxID=65489 RepID=A0A0D3FX15_9ORYZ
MGRYVYFRLTQSPIRDMWFRFRGRKRRETARAPGREPAFPAARIAGEAPKPYRAIILFLSAALPSQPAAPTLVAAGRSRPRTAGDEIGEEAGRGCPWRRGAATWLRRPASSSPLVLLMAIVKGMFCLSATRDQMKKQGICSSTVNFTSSIGLRSDLDLDGSLYYCTVVDPIFILLPILKAARMSSLNSFTVLQNGKDPGKFRQLDEILYVEGYPGYQHLMGIAGNHIDLVCEVKEVANVKFFRLDDSKVLSWLCCKVHNLKEVFPKLGKNYAAQGEKELLKDAVQIIREYLNDEPWLTLDIKEIIEANKTSEASFCAENSPVPLRPAEEKLGSSSTRSSKGRPAKKQKAEVESKNIKDMFRRVTRKGT